MAAVRGHIRRTQRGATAVVRPHLRKTISKTIKWGFDLTDFGTAEKFQGILNRFGLKSYRKIESSFKSVDGSTVRYYSFEWSKPGLKIITGTNPITGEYSSPQQRGKEFGYASYIGIEGDERLVLALKDEIKKKGDIKGESEYDREFI